MRQLFSKPWFLPALMLAVGALFAFWGLIGRGPLNYVAAAILLFFALRFVSTTQVQSRPVSGVDEHLAAGGVVVYWRPGCQFCARLIRELGSEERYVPYWVNIWDDPAAASRVSQYHQGNETVPTVVTADGHFVAKDAETYDRAKAVIRRATPVD
ncbi:glutaredoxin domain-containing protein [Citricoccus sp. I39-566]|uniref:glutaredoxin domain-containing protein n=1 Tax=Citricoccus sp. I39-566 TaxID=3073268 RepID=UPI00286B212C|nr:glutaredoxin domain-containing protein [Citricoccus sp. I39-566]WMY79738.1 glutaredoxin domain-containing protein [Citricoccus sp. I39-566]